MTSELRTWVGITAGVFAPIGILTGAAAAAIVQPSIVVHVWRLLTKTLSAIKTLKEMQ